MLVRLNLSTKPVASHRAFLLGALALGVLGTALLIGLGWHYYSLRSEASQFRAKRQQYEQEIAQLTAKKQELDRYFSQPQSVGLQERAAFISSVVSARSINWTEMFMELERRMPPGVHVIRIEPKLEKGVVSVHFVAGATNQEAELKLLKAMEASKNFTQVQLVSERLATQPGGDPITFEFTAEYWANV